MTLRKLLGGLAAAIVLTVPLAADTVYMYTGQDFTALTDPPGSYTLDDFVSGEITLASPLGDNLSFSSSADGNVIPVSFSFSDGVQTFTNSSGLTSVDFNIETNASGQITEWFISLSDGPGTSTITTSDSGAGVFDSGDQGDDSTGGDNLNKAGTWTSSSPSTVPEPENLALLGVAMVAIAVFHRKLRRAKA